MTARRRFISYSRVSKVGERGEALISPELQQHAQAAYAAQNNIVIVGEPVVDLDETGRRFEKRQIKDIIARIEAGEADGVLLWKWSRWGRNLLQSKIYLAAVEAAGGEVRAATEDFDPTTTVGKFTRDQMLLIAELLSNQISDGWKDVQARRRRHDLAHGGPIPYGYRRPERRDEPPPPDPVAGPVVKRLYLDYLAGVGPRTLVNGLNERGLRTPRGNAFSLTSLVKLLDSGFAAGLLRVDVDRATGAHRLVQGAHEAIIDAETWRDYQAEREKRRVVHPKQRQPKWPLGGGLTTCADCGGPMSLNRYVASPGKESYARCSRHLHQGSAVCPGNEIARARLDTIVALWLGGRIKEWAEVAAGARDVGDSRDRLAKRLDELRADEERLATGRTVAARLVARGDMTERDFLAAKREADRELAEVAAEATAARAELDALAPGRDVYERLARDSAGLTPEAWAVQLRRLVRELRVGRETVTLVPWHGEPVVHDRTALQPGGARRRGPNGRFAPGAPPEPEWPEGLALVAPES